MYMNLIFNSQKKIGLIVLGAALVMAGFLVFYDSDSFKKSLADIKKEKEAALQVEGFNLKQENKDLGVISSEDLSALLTGERPPENITQKFADNLAGGFIQVNPEGVSNDGTVIVPDGEITLEQTLKDYSGDLNWEDKYVETKDLNISNNNSKENIINYYSQLADVTFKYANKMEGVVYNLKYFAEDMNEEYIKNIVVYYNQLIEELKKISTPSSWSDIHKEIINTSIAMREIFYELQNWREDPLGALVGFNILPELEGKYESINLIIEDRLKIDEISFNTKDLF